MPVREVSLGDYVLFGGEVAVIAILEAVTRLLPGVLGNADSLTEESHAAGLLEAPVYTKPASWRGPTCPEVLRSGDHGRIARWRRTRSLLRTAARRPTCSPRTRRIARRSGPGAREGGFRITARMWQSSEVAVRRHVVAADEDPGMRGQNHPFAHRTPVRFEYDEDAAMNTLDALDAQSQRTDLPDFRAG
jgi:hypothetical protein